MKIATLILAFNEEETIERVLKQWDGVVDKQLVLISKNPWHGNIIPRDDTYKIAVEYAETIVMDWKTEHDQRNWGLARLYDYDYVLIADADELYTEQEKSAIISVLESGKEDAVGRRMFYDAYRAGSVKTYWKTEEYIFDPPDQHKPVIAVNPKKILFTEFRAIAPDIEQPTLDITMHHLSYCKSNEKILEKIQTFEHYDLIKESWYENVWKKWTPDMQDVRPYGIENSKAIYSPLPKELCQKK